MDTEGRRRKNERKFGSWQSLPDGGRVYILEIQGHYGWRARYLKQVDSVEETTKFWQEIYDQTGRLIEIHEKYPEDKGHRRV
jgi:hypothetical protein